MTVAIIGWGSLIWDPRGLPLVGEWRTGGPVLPIEFSRISGNGRLTLVIDETHGAPVSTRFATSARQDLTLAIGDLREREGTERIGFVDLRSDQQTAGAPEICTIMRDWAKANSFDAAIWTALGRKFKDAIGVQFSPRAAFNYVEGLADPKRQAAFDYIQKAPAEVQTPFRKLFNQHHPA